MITQKRTGSEQISLVRALSKLGYASRTVAHDLIRSRRVTVNARVITSPNAWIDLRVDRISVDGKPVRRHRLLYIAMNKPRGVLTTRSDERLRKTVYDLLPEVKEWVFPVGRLDKDSAGLLLFTNDVRFGEMLTNPAHKIKKTYEVRLDRPLADGHRRVMEEGMTLHDGTVLQAASVQVNATDPLVVTLRISEGKNRQIRRMAEDLGYEVRELVRTSIGPLRLGTLGEGEVRALTAQEVTAMMLPPKQKGIHDSDR